MKRVKPFNPEKFETNFIVAVALLCAGLLIYLGIQGPLFEGNIVYKTHSTVYNQLIAQDAVNTFIIAPILIIGALALYERKRLGRYLLVLTPLFLIYYAISYMIGWEWMAMEYQGNSQNYFFYFLGVMIAAILIMFYCLGAFPPRQKPRFTKRILVSYSAVLIVFLSLFAMMWSKEIFQVINTGTARGYDLSPTAFWLVRCFDLGFTIPLGFVSLYLLWVKPQSSMAVQMLFMGFSLA
ncbi:MAG: hypothetical protein PHO32_04265 [Candidatus Cloacimonetes bacterium]|nr:hypothetical protein [Candidatus Cloacimonadota bacterium]